VTAIASITAAIATVEILDFLYYDVEFIALVLRVFMHYVPVLIPSPDNVESAKVQHQ
jgi:hypothetical protein